MLEEHRVVKEAQKEVNPRIKWKLIADLFEKREKK